MVGCCSCLSCCDPLQARMSAFHHDAAKPRRILAGMKHRNTAAKGVPHQPVVKYVVTNKGSGKHVTHLFEPRDGHTGGPAMPRQVEIKPGIIAERLADRLPLAAIARKSMQKDQPGVTWLTGLLRAC